MGTDKERNIINRDNRVSKEYYYRHLPHYQPRGYVYFITFRLKDSLPVHIINKLKEEWKADIAKILADTPPNDVPAKKSYYQSHYFAKFDKLLENSLSGEMFLGDERIAEIVKDEIHALDGKNYELIAYSIMPNHVHMVFSIPIEDREGMDIQLKDIKSEKLAPVTAILKKLKGATSRKCNQILGRTGGFWQQESYDHVVRNGEQPGKVIRYVLNNPVKAKLCGEWTEWKYSYCKYFKM